MADPFEEDPPEPISPPPSPVRRVGYSSRGNASPVGDTGEPPLTLGDPREAEQEATGLRRRYAINQRDQADLEKRTRSAQREADFRSKGQKFYTDSFGELQPVLDDAGQPQFSTTPWKKTKDEASGQFTWARRGEQGQTETRKPKITTSGDVKDPNLYYDFESQGREPIGHVDDLTNSPDTEVAREAAAYRLKRNGALRKESLRPLQDNFDSAQSALDSAKLRKSDLDTQLSRLNEQIASLDQNPAIKQTAGGFLGIGAEPTPEAKRLQAQRQALQSQVDDLSKQSADLATSTDKGGSLFAAHERSKLELDAWAHQSKVDELGDLATQRRVWLRSQNRAEKDDPVLAQILSKQAEFGTKASETAQRRAALEEQFNAARQASAADSTVADESKLKADAAFLEDRRRAVAAGFQKLGEDAAAGRLDPATVAAARQSMLDFERDYAKTAGQLAGKGDSLLRQHRIENAAARRTMAQGEELYALDKNASSTLQRVVEGTRDASGEKRDILSQSLAVQEAAKAAAFYSGDADYSDSLYAKLPGKQIAIHPNAFTLAGQKPDGSDRAFTWRDVIDTAVKAGDLDPKRADAMRRDLSIRETLAQESAVDATLDNDTFHRWVLKTHPDLAQPTGFFSWKLADISAPTASPALRAAAKEFLKAEPSTAQKIWNGIKMVGVGALGVGADAVRAVLPDDNSGAKAIQDFTEGLNSMTMDPRLDKHWLGQIGQGLGSSLAFANPAGAAGGLVEGLGLGAKVAKWTVGGVIAATGAAAQGQQMYDEARQSGATREVADGARWLGYILGASEVAPLGDIVRRFGSAKAFSLGAAVKSAVAEIGEDAIQEVGQQAGNNAVARMLYDQNRSMFDGLADSATAAGGSAAIMSLLSSVAAGVRYHRTVGLLNAAQQSRSISDARLNATFARPEVQAVSDMLPPVSLVTDQFAEQRTQLQEAIRAEATKKEPSEEVLLGLHEQLAQVEIMAGSTARSLASHALDVADAAAQAKAAPDHFQIDPETQQPVSDAATAGANRDAATALLRISAGIPTAQLTEAEQQGLQIIGAELGSDMVRDVGGQSVITDKARAWASEIAPATARVLTQTEGDQLASLSAASNTAAANPKPKKQDGQKEKGRPQGLLNQSVTPVAENNRSTAVGASASFTNEAGQREQVSIPIGAVVPSTKSAVRDQTSAEQYLAETRKAPVRDVEFSAGKATVAKTATVPAGAEKGLPAAGQKTASQPAAVRGAVSPGSVLRHLVAPMRAAGAADSDIARTAVDLSKRVNSTVGNYRPLFGDRIEVTDQPTGGGGFVYDAKRDALVISTADLARDASSIRDHPERVQQLVREEAIHRAAVRLEKRGEWKASDLWKSLAPETRDAFVRAYNQGHGENSGAKTTDSWAMGHEMVRMLVQGRLAVKDGKLAIDGAAISEETASPTVIHRLADVLRRIRQYFTDLAGTLSREGNAPETVAEVDRVVDLVTRSLQALETINKPTGVTPVAENTAKTLQGDALDGEWVRFAPESGSLNVPRTEMPQFQNEHMGALTQFLSARGITHQTEEVLPGTLKPTQLEYSETKVGKLVKMGKEGKLKPRSILVSSDNYVLDRHHQYVAALHHAPNEPVQILRFNAPIQQLFDAVHDFPLVEYAGGVKPSASKRPETRAAAAPNAEAEAKARSEDAARQFNNRIAAQLGVAPEQIGKIEKVTHKGRTVETVNVVIEAEQANTSHNPDGTIRADYPQDLQPRARSEGIYLEQQRKIATSPNLAEEMLSGTPDRGTPIMAKVGDQVVTVIGNGRANAKALMYSAPDLAATAAAFKQQLVEHAQEKGIDPASAAKLNHPVFARFIVEPMSLADLRAFSQASNEFSGAATNAVEQAKVDASRFTPAILSFFNPDYDLDSAKNEDFRREFVRQVIGRNENITAPDLRRRVHAALFAKAFGDTEAGMAAFSRLAGEDDEGVRNLVRAMLDVAPAFAAMRQRIADGTLHPLDLAPALSQAVQDIAVALREKPAKQSTDAALDGLINQGQLGVDDSRDDLERNLLRFLIDNRRNRADLVRGLSAYVSGVYAVGDPRQEDMFGGGKPSAAEILNAATDPAASERTALASQIGNLLSSGVAELPDDERMLNEGGNREFPMDGYRVSRAGGNDRLRLIGEIWPMYERAYAAIGRQFAHAAALMGEKSLFDVVRSADGTALAFAVRKITPHGYKTIASGQNGTPEGVAAWKRQAQEYRVPGNYSEMSDRPLLYALNNNFPTVPAADAAAILGKAITPAEDGQGYYRKIDGLTEPKLKRMVGVPVLWKSQTTNSLPPKGATSLSSNENSPAPTSAPSGEPSLSTPPTTSPRPTPSTSSPASPSPSRLSSGQGSLFDDLIGDYAQKLPPRAKRSKTETAKTVAKEIPALANNAGAIDDIFAWAQSAAPLTEPTAVRSEPSATTPDAPNRQRTDTATSGQNGGRAFTERESDDLGPLFGHAGPQGAPTASDQPNRAPDGDVAGTSPVQSDAVVPGESSRAGVEQAGGSPAIRADDGSLSVTLPGDRARAGGRADARAAAEARRLARIARSRGLGVDEQNHRIAEGDTLVERGNKTRLRGNLAAIRLLRTLQGAKRNATPEEKRILAKYVGWGALSQVFDRQKGEAVERGDLDELRSDLESAREMAQRYGNVSYYQTRVEKAEAELKSLENWDNTWGESYRALKQMLTPEEWEAARNSTENAHYTDRAVIGAMWQALENMGFRGGRVLEPAGGVGHFFGLMPEEMMRASELFGVELDTISGGIFRALYPDAQIQVSGFERARLPDNTFDVAISNVPFSEIGPVDPLHDKAKLNLHNYFFAKALDKVRPGGLVAFITTAHTLESQPRQRAYLAQLGDFIGAVRLPNNAFSANAGTEVTTDIVFMRKRDGVGASPFAQAWLQKTKVGEDTIPAADGGEKTVPISINEYFARHPEMVLGENSMRGTMYAGPSKNGQYTVLPTAGDLGKKLAAALRRLPAAYTESGESTPAVLATTSTARDGAFSYENGELGIQRNGTWQSLAEASPEFFGEGKIKYRRKAGEFVRLRDAYRTHLAVMANPAATAAEIARGIGELNHLYDQFTGQWGTLENGRHRELKSDPDFYLLKGLESVETSTDPETSEQIERIVKADVLRKRTIFPALAPTSAANTLDALRISQAWKGHLDLDFMAELRGDEPASIKQELLETGAAFENPRTGQLETREIYLSGRVREKLRQAEESAKTNPDYQRNVEALRAVQPPLVLVREITPKLGGGWVPPALLEAFLDHTGFGEVKVRYTQIGDFDRWTITPARAAENSRANLSLFASAKKSGLELLSYALDQRTPQVFDTDPKSKKRTFNAQETAAAQAALKRLTDAWQEFARGDAEVSVMIDGKRVTAPVSQITSDAFNETFNGTVPRVYDGSHLTLPGSAPFLLGPPEEGGMRQHQKDGIWRAVQDGTAFLAHGVGAGKTRELIAIGLEWKRLGLAKKPMLVVHNPTLNQFANETRKIYPGARTLVATKEDLQKENRRAFAARVASGDWDLVIIAHSSFNLIDDDPAVVEKFIAEQKADVEQALKDRLSEIGADSTDDREAKRDPTVKQLVKMLRALEARLLKATQLKNKDDAVLFQQLGVDGLLIDEAHLFKKVPFVSKMGQVAGLDMSSSARASNLLMRLNDVRARANGRNVVLATGTPITNTLAEVWNMIRLTSPETLKEFGVPTFDQFAAAFASASSVLRSAQATT